MESPNINRRDFLKELAAAGAVVTMPEILQAQEQGDAEFEDFPYTELDKETLRGIHPDQFLDFVDRVYKFEDLPEGHGLFTGKGFAYVKSLSVETERVGWIDSDGHSLVVMEADWENEYVDDLSIENSGEGYVNIIYTDKNGSDGRVLVHYWDKLDLLS